MWWLCSRLWSWSCPPEEGIFVRGDDRSISARRSPSLSGAETRRAFLNRLEASRRIRRSPQGPARQENRKLTGLTFFFLFLFCRRGGRVRRAPDEAAAAPAMRAASHAAVAGGVPRVDGDDGDEGWWC